MSVLIIGAGLGGLTLAQCLKKANISVKVFERDLASDFRAQGYRIRINGFGLDALEECLPTEIWELFKDTCPAIKLGAVFIDALTGEVNHRPLGPRPPGMGAPGNGQNTQGPLAGPSGPAGPPPQFSPGGRPGGPMAFMMPDRQPYTADRTLMREVLIRGLEKDIFFGKEFSHYIETPDGIQAFFKDGSFFSGALLVGADGSRSRVRKQLIPEHKILDAGARLLYGKTYLNQDTDEKIDPEALKVMTVIKEQKPEADNLMLFIEAIRFPKEQTNKDAKAFHVPKDYIYWVLGGQTSIFGIPDEQLLRMSSEKVAKLSIDITSKWQPQLRSILELQDTTQTSALRVSTALPEMVPWQSSARVTVIGDAVHVMPPTGGVGANTALRDAATLGKLIVENGINKIGIDEIATYEKLMREYSEESLKGSWLGRQHLLGPKNLEDCIPVDT